MSTHPNAILMVTLTPDHLARKTYRAIIASDGGDDGKRVKISGIDYNILVMEGDYDEGFQITAKEGDIVLFDMVTYGYGEIIEWAKLEAQKMKLEEWAKDVCEKHSCTFEISITANYW